MKTLTPVKYIDLGLTDFEKAWKFQQKLFNENVHIKNQQGKNNIIHNTDTTNYLILCEHPHVYTLGKSGSESNLLVNREFLKSKGATFFRIDRGGDITYHGPGQIVGYPILDIEKFRLGIKDYVHLIEESIILLLKSYYLSGQRLKGATGVWLDTDDPLKVRKICAIGVKASRHITMHGFALNVNTDLDFFSYINPCGFTNKSVTSLEKELGKKQDQAEVIKKLILRFEQVFGAKII